MSSDEPRTLEHAAIYQHIGECRDEMIMHQSRCIEEFEIRHIAEQHVAMMSVAFQFPELANKALGTPKTELEGGGRNDDGWDHKIEDLYLKLGNGGKLRMNLDWKDRAAVIIAIALMAAKAIGWF